MVDDFGTDEIVAWGSGGDRYGYHPDAEALLVSLGSVRY